MLQCALVFYSTCYYRLKYLVQGKTMQTLSEGELRNGGLEVRASNELCNHQFLLGTRIAWSFHEKTHLLVDDLYLSTKCSGSTEKLQNDVLTMWNFFFHLRWGIGEYGCTWREVMVRLGPVSWTIFWLLLSLIRANLKIFPSTLQSSIRLQRYSPLHFVCKKDKP